MNIDSYSIKPDVRSPMGNLDRVSRQDIPQFGSSHVQDYIVVRFEIEKDFCSTRFEDQSRGFFTQQHRFHLWNFRLPLAQT